MYVYILVETTGEYSDRTWTIEQASLDLEVISDIYLSRSFGDENDIKNKIIEACEFKEPCIPISLSLERWHLHKSLFRLMYNLSLCELDIHKRKLSTKDNINEIDTITNFYNLQYNFKLNQFVITTAGVPNIGFTDCFDENFVIPDNEQITSTPKLNMMNKLWNSIFNDSLNTIYKR